MNLIQKGRGIASAALCAALLGISQVASAAPTGIGAVAALFDFDDVEAGMIAVAGGMVVLLLVVIGWRFFKRIAK